MSAACSAPRTPSGAARTNPGDRGAGRRKYAGGGGPMVQFDRRPYEYKVAQLEAQLAEAKQNVLVLQSNVEAATQTAARAKVELDYQQYQKAMFDKLAQEQAVRGEDVVQRATTVAAAQATHDGALEAPRFRAPAEWPVRVPAGSRPHGRPRLPRYPRYPRLPVRECRGFEEREPLATAPRAEGLGSGPRHGELRLRHRRRRIGRAACSPTG